MRQAFHILKKDFRRLRYEIAGLVALALAYGWIEPRGYRPEIQFLLVAGVGLLISMVIHAEAIPGDKQFWTTRPYRWPSLLAAKLIFILLFVNLPVFIARVVIVLSDGIPIGSALSGLIWSQLWLLLGIGVPVAALAALTRGLVTFVFAATAILAFIFAVPSFTYQFHSSWLSGLQWIRNGIVLAVLVAACSAIFYNQYRNRQSSGSRILAGAGAVLVVGMSWFMTEDFAMDLQAGLSQQALDPSALQIVSAPVLRIVPANNYLRGDPEEAHIDLDITLKNVPPGFDVYAEEVTYSLTEADGLRWTSGQRNLGAVVSQGVFYKAPSWISPEFFAATHDKPVEFKATVFFSLFGNPREKTVVLEQTPQNVMDDMQCWANTMGHLNCRSVSGLSMNLVTATSGLLTVPIRSWLTYALVPVGANLNPIQEDGNSELRIVGGKVSIALKERLGYVRRDFVIPSVRLDDLIKR